MGKQNVIYPHYEVLLNQKRTEVLTHVTTWMNLEDIMLSETSHIRKDKYCKFLFICNV